MKLKAIIFITFVLFAVPVQAEYKFADSWTWSDTAYQGVFLALLGVDWAQTRTQAKNDWVIDGKQYSEINPIMGLHPDTGTVDAYFSISAVGHTLVSMALPPKATLFGQDINPRRIWQGLFISVEVWSTVNNYALGVRIEL